MNAIATSSASVLDLIDDFDHFTHDLSPKCQQDVLRKLDCVRQLINAPFGARAEITSALAHKYNIGKSTISRYRTAFLKGGYSALIDYRAFPKETGLPAPFVSFAQGLWDQLDRTDDGAEVQRQLLDILNLWRSTGDPKHRIPGYKNPPANAPHQDHPRSWSKRNILRLKPTARTRALTKRGAKEASNYSPFVLTTRVGSAFMSRVLFDDQDHDHIVSGGELALTGVDKACRPVEFAALDFYTACHLDQHLRLEYPQKDSTTGKITNKTLTGAEFQWFVIHILQTEGYRTDALGTELIGEHKTAALWKAKGRETFNGHHSLADALHAFTDGHIRSNVSGLFNDPALAGMFMRPQSTGNFRFKTWIESAFRLVRTYMQGVVGQTGSNARLNGNDKIYGIQKRETQLLKFVQSHKLCDQQATLLGCIIEEAPDFAKNKLASSLLSFTDFANVVAQVYAAINRRTDHTLEGWAECGFVQQLWRPSLDCDDWFTESELNQIADPLQRTALITRINSDPRAYTRQQKLSPFHAKEFSARHDSAVLKKLPDSIIPFILPIDMAHEAKVQSNHTFTLPNSLWPDTRDSYVASIKTRHGMHSLSPGHRLLVFASPFGDGKAHLIDRETQQYLGTIHRTVRAAAYDQQAKLAQLGVRNQLTTALDAPVHDRNRNIAAEEQAREARNNIILKGQPKPGEKALEDLRQRNTDDQAISTAFDRLADLGEDEESTVPEIQY